MQCTKTNVIESRKVAKIIQDNKTGENVNIT